MDILIIQHILIAKCCTGWGEGGEKEHCADKITLIINLGWQVSAEQRVGPAQDELVDDTAQLGAALSPGRRLGLGRIGLAAL